MDNSIIIKRNELYEKVWQTAMIKLAEEYGISGNGLKKICIKLKIPFPPIGYWQKLAAGNQIEKPPLPEINNDAPDFYELRVEKKPEYPVDEKYKILIEKEGDPYNKINVTKRLGLLHPLISITKNTLSDLTPDSDGLLRRVRSEILAIAVSPKNLSRALNIMNTLLRELERRGFQIKIEMNYHERNETFVIKDGQKIQIELRETLKMNKIKINKSEYPWRHSDYETKLVPTGELRLEIKNVYGGNIAKILKDQTNHTLEEQLNEFIINIYKAINYFNIRDKQREEEERIEEEKQNQRNEILKQKRLEKEKTVKLFQMVKWWHKANLVRNFVTQLEENLIKANALSEEKKQWIQWAREKAETLNPLNDMTNLNTN